MDALKELRQELSTLKPGRGRRYPPEARRRILALTHRLHAQGLSRADIARALDISDKTLQRWIREGETTTRRGESLPEPIPLRPVMVEPRSVPAPRDQLVVVSPTGYVVEGLDLDGVVTLLRKLS